MPNRYGAFESGEVSSDRLVLEFELVKRLYAANLLDDDLDWSSYDTAALNLFVQLDIDEVYEELKQRHAENKNISKEKLMQIDFIHQCLEEGSIVNRYQRQKISSQLLFNLIWLVVSILVLMGGFIFDYMKFNGQHQFIRSLHRPLTAKRRHLSFKDDHFIICLAMIHVVALGCIIVTTRLNSPMVFFEIVIFGIVLVLYIVEAQQIVQFLLNFRENRQPNVYNYLYS